MSEWLVSKTTNGNADILEDGGSENHIYVIALGLRIDKAKQIVREHNAHESLVVLAKRYRLVTSERYRRTKRDPMLRKYRKTLSDIDAVLAQAEGREL